MPLSTNTVGLSCGEKESSGCSSSDWSDYLNIFYIITEKAWDIPLFVFMLGLSL